MRHETGIDRSCNLRVIDGNADSRREVVITVLELYNALDEFLKTDFDKAQIGVSFAVNSQENGGSTHEIPYL